MAADTPFNPNFLEQAITGALPPTIPFAPARTIKEPFAVHNEETANWVVRKIAESQAYARRVQEYAERELRRAAREEIFFRKHYGPQLEAWARQQMSKQGGKKKYVRLPAGTIGYRTTRPRLLIKNDDELIRWCREFLPDAVIRTERVLKLTIRDHLEKTGECPDGAEVIPGSEKFYIK